MNLLRIFQTHYFGVYTISKHSFRTILTAHEKFQDTQPIWRLCAKPNVINIFSKFRTLMRKL